MPLNAQILADLRRLFAGSIDDDALASFLVANSNLPAARANLELVDAVATASANRADLVPIFSGWLNRSTSKNDPVEFLSLTAAVGLGAIFLGAGDPLREIVVSLLHEAANDPRWRVREGVAMGLQRIGEAEFEELEQILRDWLPNASLLEQRAIVAALAHTPILKHTDTAITALELAAPIALGLAEVGTVARKTEEFKVLKQGLSYALSVLVAASPDRGFRLLHDLAATGDKDAVAVVQANLGKARLAKPFAAEVARLKHDLAMN